MLALRLVYVVVVVAEDLLCRSPVQQLFYIASEQLAP
jgi:hypothetical protein